MDKSKLGAVSLAIAALVSSAGCNKSVDSDMRVIHKTISVPVCKYIVQRGDSIEGLFKSEMGNPFYKRENVSTHDRFLLHGGYAGNQAVQFSFNEYDVLRLVNNAGENYDKLWYETTLRSGQTILVPDLNQNGRIGHQACDAQGTFAFDATYNRNTQKDTKTIAYNGQTINVD